jgi:hypothetical protein
MNSNDNKTSRELKHEVLQELNQVNSDIDRIQGRLTPGQIIDEVVFQPVGRNPRAVFDHLRSNPVGTAFLGIGTLLLMENDSHVTYEGQIGSQWENTRYQAALLKGRVSDIQSDFDERVAGVSGKVHNVIDSAKSKVRNIKSKFSGADDSSGDSSAAELAGGGELGASSLDDLKESITDKFGKIDEVRQTVENFASEELVAVKNLDPMMYVAIGAGLGALTGIALPVSEKEQELIDQKASGKLNEFSTEFQDALNQSVKVLKDEFLGRFTDMDLSLFGHKQQSPNQPNI